MKLVRIDDKIPHIYKGRMMRVGDTLVTTSECYPNFHRLGYRAAEEEEVECAYSEELEAPETVTEDEKE